jgi:hypothetical protein
MAAERVRSDVVVQGERKITVECLGAPVDVDAWIRRVESEYGATDVRHVAWKDPAEDPAIEVHHLVVLWWPIPPTPLMPSGQGGRKRS